MKRAFASLLDVLVTPVLFLLALLGRMSKGSVDVGLGPEPLINNCFHKRALERYGYTAETFVDQSYYITQDFDVKIGPWPAGLGLFVAYAMFARAVFRYRCLYIYFNGGPLGTRPLTWRFEPVLYRLAGVRVVVMPYGGDVQDMTRSRNMLFRDAMAADYPEHAARRPRIAAQIDLWTRGADHVLSGVEWVDYMPGWDTLMLAHFSIDVDAIDPVPAAPDSSAPLRVFHAPNHAAIKGTDYLVAAVDELNAEGVAVELEMRQRVPNDVIRACIRDCDVVADQFVVGWYAMFALEAMSTGKPVLCYLRDDLVDLYTAKGLVEPGEIPLVNCDVNSIKERLRHLAQNRGELAGIGLRGREFVKKHHSLQAVGAVFDRINKQIGVDPSGVTPPDIEPESTCAA